MFFDIHKDIVQILLMLQVLFTNSYVEDLFCGAPFGSEPSRYRFSFRYDDFQHDFNCVTNEAND